MKKVFILIEAMFANEIFLILADRFTKITEQTIDQIKLKTIKSEMSSSIVERTLARL